MPDIFPTAQTLTANFCPADWQDVIDEFATKLAISEVTDDEVIIQVADPTPVDDDDKLWIKVTAGAPYVGYALVKQNSKWLHIQGRPLYYADSSAAADAIVLSSTGYGNGAYDVVQYLQDRIFIIRVANTNTGAVTVALDSIPAKALRKNNNTDLSAGEIVAGMLIAVAYDPTDDIFEMLSPVVQAAATPTSNFDVLDPGPQNAPAASGTLTFTHTYGAVPSFYKAVLVCTATDQGYAENDEVDIWCVGWSASNTGLPIWSVVADSTTVKVIRGNPGTPTNIFITPKGGGAHQTPDFTTPKWKVKVYAAL